MYPYLEAIIALHYIVRIYLKYVSLKTTTVLQFCYKSIVYDIIYNRFATKLKYIPVIRLFSVARHGKGEVDHVVIRRYIVTGGIILGDCLDFLEKKFEEKNILKVYVKEINTTLNVARAEACLKIYPAY